MLRKLGRLTGGGREGESVSVPPGQYATEKFPVLTFGDTPNIPQDRWRFRVFGLVEEEVTLDWEGLTDLGKITLNAEFHCVTQWSRLKNTWEGVPFTALMKRL